MIFTLHVWNYHNVTDLLSKVHEFEISADATLPIVQVIRARLHMTTHIADLVLLEFNGMTNQMEVVSEGCEIIDAPCANIINNTVHVLHQLMKCPISIVFADLSVDRTSIFGIDSSNGSMRRNFMIHPEAPLITITSDYLLKCNLRKDEVVFCYHRVQLDKNSSMYNLAGSNSEFEQTIVCYSKH